MAHSDQLRARALAKLKNIILFEPRDSSLGSSMLEGSGILMPADQQARILQDVYAMQSTATLLKHSSSRTILPWVVEQNSGQATSAHGGRPHARPT